MKFLLLAGSFHKSSRTQALLRFIASVLDEHETVNWPLNELPFYCEEISADKPQTVLDFLAAVEEADAIVVCSPEYNHSIPAVLKNAIDWASRPAFKSVLKDKPVTVITQANSPVGGARAQAHIKLVFDSTLSRIHPCHEMMIAGVDEKVDAEGILKDDKTAERLRRHLQDFIGYIELFPGRQR